MDTKLIGNDAVELLSRITGQSVSQRDLTPPVIFLAALVTALLGVVHADGTVTEAEQKRLLETLYRFSPEKSDVRRLTHLMIKGVRENQLYGKPDKLQVLTAPLSESEKLLLLGFGYEMSAADGEMDTREKEYLQLIANRLNIDLRYQAVLEASFSGQGVADVAGLAQLRDLLAPARFYELDVVFINAASYFIEKLQNLPEEQIENSGQQVTQQSSISSEINQLQNQGQAVVNFLKKFGEKITENLPGYSKANLSQHFPVLGYETLQKFQDKYQNIKNILIEISQLIQECVSRGFLPESFIQDSSEVYQKLQSQQFRVAVVGEFSVGKSTLLNALVGEELQPVRAIPCSGVITILRHGAKKRVICRYVDGREKEIAVDQYKAKASIPKDVALNKQHSNELASSEIEEIIYEHPSLGLCKNGVELVDSPGLNENPNRTDITEKLIENSDAIIFMMRANQVLTEMELYLLQDLRKKLNRTKGDEPANTIFVLVNFWNFLRTEEDREDVRLRIENSLLGQNGGVPIIAGENRIHYISAQPALDAILKRTEDESLKTFRRFTQSLEKFLTSEQGSIKIQQSIIKIKELSQKVFAELNQAKKILDKQFRLSEADLQNILEKIGEATGQKVKICELSDQLMESAIQEAKKSWLEWCDRQTWRNEIESKSQSWSSKDSATGNQKALIKDYTNQFNQDLSKAIEVWLNEKIKKEVIQPKIEILDNTILRDLNAINISSSRIYGQLGSNINKQLESDKFSGLKEELWAFGGLLGFWGGGAGAAAALVALTGVGLPIVVVGGLAGAVVSWALGTGRDEAKLQSKIKQKILADGFKMFDNSKSELSNKVSKIVRSVFEQRVQTASEHIKRAILELENLVEQQEKVHQQTVEQRNEQKAWIAQKRQKLEQLLLEVEGIQIN